MKRCLGHLLALAMMVSMVVPAMAVTEKHNYQTIDLSGPYEEYDAKQRQESINQDIREAGGVSGQINVKLNDKCVSFPDAVPEIHNDRTMVPVRAVMEALGAKVESLENNCVQISYGDTSLRMVIGDKMVTVEKDGTSEQVELDANSYLKQDRVYVPLRFISEAFGFDVFWDQDYKTVVILDRTAIINQLNEQFATVNRFMQSQTKLLTGNWKSESDFNISVELMNNIDGNKTFNVKGSSIAHFGDGAMTMDSTLDLSQLAAMLEGFAALADETDGAMFDIIMPYMKENHFSIKILPDGQYYIKTEWYDLLAENFFGIAIDDSNETWYHVGEIEPTLFTAEGYTIGNYLYSMTKTNMVYMDAFTSYDTLMEMAQQAERLIGNANFEKQGKNYVWNMDKEQLLSWVGEDQEAQDIFNSLFQELNLTVTFTTDGVYSIQGTVKLKMEGLGSLVSMTMDQSGSTSNSKSTLELQVRNLFNLTMKGNSRASKVQKVPDASIPQNAQIIDLMDLLW